MTATKLPIGRALLIKAEPSYNGGGTLSASTDGILVTDDIVPTHEYAHDGARRQPPGMAGYMRRVAPAGPRITFPFAHEAKGAAVAYSASVVPSVHRALLAAGFDGAVTVTGGSEKWDYTPTPLTGTPTSLAAEVYGRGQKYPVTGIYLNLESIEFGDGMVPHWTFQARGLRGAVSDVSFPSITYPTLTTEPPKSAGLVLTFGSFTTNAIIRSGSLKMNRELGWRANLNAASGDAGLSPGRRTPTIELLFEATALVGSPFHTSAGLDPYKLYEAGTELTAQIDIGSVQYNRFSIIPGKLQMMGPPVEESDEGAALWRVTCQCNPTSVNNNDDTTIRFN
jgi:hypothetical protein